MLTVQIMVIETHFDRCLIFFGDLSAPLEHSPQTDKSHLPGN